MDFRDAFKAQRLSELAVVMSEALFFIIYMWTHNNFSTISDRRTQGRIPLKSRCMFETFRVVLIWAGGASAAGWLGCSHGKDDVFFLQLRGGSPLQKTQQRNKEMVNLMQFLIEPPDGSSENRGMQITEKMCRRRTAVGGGKDTLTVVITGTKLYLRFDKG